MYKKLSKYIGKKILGKYLLKEIDITDIVIYRNCNKFIFGDKILPKNTISLSFLYKDKYFIITLHIVNYKFKIENGSEYIDLKEYLSNLIKKFEDKFFIIKEYNDIKKMSKMDYIFCYMFIDYLDINLFLQVDNYDSLNQKNKEPIVLKSTKNIIYNSDRSKIKKIENLYVEKSFKWINSMYGINKKDFIYNSIFLVIFGLIKDKIVLYDNTIVFKMLLYHNNPLDYSISNIIETLIKFNKNTFIGKHNGLKISLIQEDPNKENFLTGNKGDIQIIDFDSVTVSFIFLQPLYLFLDNSLSKNNNYIDMIKIFKYILFKFKDDYYIEDLKLLGVDKIFDIYNRVFMLGINLNNDWLKLNDIELEYKRNFFKVNKTIIINLYNDLLKYKTL